MPAAVTFWQLPEEEEALLRYVARTGDILACRWPAASDPALFEPQSFLEYVDEHDPDDVLIGPREFMDQSVLGRFEHEGRVMYRHEWSDDPLILYSRPRFRSSRQLGGSNMCADWHWPGWPPVRKPEPFIKWAQKVFRWVRKFTPSWHQYKSYRVTDKVAVEIAKGLEIVP